VSFNVLDLQKVEEASRLFLLIIWRRFRAELQGRVLLEDNPQN